MEAFLLFLAAATLGFGVLLGLDLWRGNWSIPFLNEVELPPGFSGPCVSVIVAARNEESMIRPALLSLLGQDYPSMEVIVVNDRSGDGTGAILREVSRQHSALRTLTVDRLPEGWLGKNHALEMGFRGASGELLLFTDADVVMHPSTLSKAVHYLQQRDRDHLTVGPDVTLPGIWLKMFVAAFAFFFFTFLRPWKAKDPTSSSYVGIGAFNLVRREAHRKIGTHQAIRMRPDDDIKLGKLIKRAGFSQEFLFGKGMLEVAWYSSLGELVEGLMKNMFAGVDYRISAVLGISLLQFLLCVWPFLGCFLTEGWTRLLNLALVALVGLFFWAEARFSNLPRWVVLGFPMMVLLGIYIHWRAMLLTFFRRGIVWRGTHYPLEQLKANKV